MKNANAIFTRTRLGIDTRVWLTMLFVFFLSLILFSFRMATSVSCVDYTITPSAVTADKPNSFYTGETIVFSASVPTAASLMWDFGDGSGPTSGNHVKHSFKHDGNYTVITTLNETCIQSLKVNIKGFVNKTPIINSVIDFANGIISTDTPHAGEKVIFSSAKSAGSYEWTVLNSPEYPTQTDSVASWKFEIPGKQIIVLKLNGDDKKVYKKQILVLQSLPVKSTVLVGGTKPAVPAYMLPPKIISFMPASGTTGTTVTITGLNFNGATAVNFGNAPAASFAILSPTTISATVGAGTSGNVSVTTKTGVGMSLTSLFTYTAPVADKTPASSADIKPKVSVIPDEEFMRMFQQVCDGKADASAFNAYLCKGSDTKVLANDGWTSVGELCKKLKEKRKVLLGHKEYKINSVQVARDATKCVTILTVNYK